MTTPSPLDRLRAAAEAIPLTSADAYFYAALARFWRLVAKWEVNSGNTEFSELDEVRAIISEVEART